MHRGWVVSISIMYLKQLTINQSLAKSCICPIILDSLLLLQSIPALEWLRMIIKRLQNIAFFGEMQALSDHS